MRLTRDEFERTGRENPLELFLQGIKAEETREKYSRTLRQVLCKILYEILEGDFEQRAEQLVRAGRENPEWVRDLLLNISKKLRERTELPVDHPEYYNPASFNNYFKPLKKLLDMNDVVVPWKRVYATFPEIDNVAESRGWERGEIQRMLGFAKRPADRAAVLVAASSGIRAGGFDLDWGDVEPVYKSGDVLGFEEWKGSKLACAMVTIYRGTGASYPAFITPEAYRALEEHRQAWAADVGRLPRPDEPIFKRDGPHPRRAGLPNIKKRVERMVVEAGLRDPGRKAQRRFDVPLMNGFRRFWNKACKESASKDSPLSSLIKKEYMMGHSGLVSLDRNYFKTHTLELAEEYLHAVPSLTIDDAERVRDAGRGMSEAGDAMDVRMARLENMVMQLCERSAK